MKVSEIEEFTTNGLVESYNLIIGKIKAFFGNRLTVAYENVKNGIYGEERARNGFYFTSLVNSDILDVLTFDCFYNYKTTSRDGNHMTINYLNDAFDQISFGFMKNYDYSGSSQHRYAADRMFSLKFFGDINNIFFINIGGENNELMVIVKSGGFYSIVSFHISDSLVDIRGLKSGNNEYYNANWINRFDIEHKILNRRYQDYQFSAYKSKDVNNDTKWRIVTAPNDSGQSDAPYISYSRYINRENKVYGIMKHQPKYEFSRDDNNALFPRNDGFTKGYFILEKDEDMHYGQVNADGLIPENTYEIGAYTYKFFPIGKHDQTSTDKFNLGVVVRVGNNG